MSKPWHGCQTLLVVISVLTLAEVNLAEVPHPEATTDVSSRVMELGYGVVQASSPLRRVDLYLTSDLGSSWRFYASDEDLEPPMTLEVEDCGLYGIFFVLRNEVGYSSGPPKPGESSPHQWILVDDTAPLAQFRQLRFLPASAAGGSDQLVVSWAAYDEHLSERPVSLYFQLVDQPGWEPLSVGIRNTGRFDWTVPKHIRGHVQIKIEVVDRARNIGTDTSATVVIPGRAQASAPGLTAPSNIPPAHAMPGVPATTVKTVSAPDPADLERARKLFELGLLHKEGGDYGVAVERLIESLSLDPQMTSPRYELAEIYHTQGDYQGSIDIYKSILELRSEDRESLRGSALASVALKRYPEALRNLEQVLASQPGDAQTWLDAGDVILMMGNAAQASKYWKEAVRLNPNNPKLRANAEQRIRKLAPNKR